MDYDRLWAPWRLDYVTGEAKKHEPASPEPAAWPQGSDRACFLCCDVAEYEDTTVADRVNRVVRHGPTSLVVLNRYPYNNGHLLIAPRAHKSDLGELDSQEVGEIHHWLVATTDLLTRGMKAEGFNVGLNLGRVAGAGLPGHLHWHVVPRWNGDTNFMPALAGARVIPQSLDSLWEFLHEELPEAV